ncbi:MAG: 50S ribosomal protein L25/general stress protein Ctc [Bacteroidales bacterium]|nr:50S ribosomal protein L25/general stress protein Ctc [Bacteroidales bacterium]MDD6583124.1 50S ribosomal protein L25/general stress protein Ctc [Bacteroidales bacterium]
MKSVSISGSLRENVGKKDAKAQRRNGMIPCVLYGGEKQYEFVVPEGQFRNLIYTPEVKYAIVNVDGKEIPAVLQASQFHPITDRLLHVDFLEVVDGKPITIGLPIRINGTSPGVLRGGRLVKKVRKLRVRGLLNDIPEFIPVDISGLDIDNSIKINELKIDNLTFVENPNAVVVAVLSTRNVEAAPTEDAAATEA